MKITLALALSTAGLLIAAQPFAHAEAPSASPPNAAAASRLPSAAAKMEFRRWRQGEPPLKLIRQEEGFCALTSVTGHFQGEGEQVRVYVADDGFWYLGGKSQQHDVAAECVIVHLPMAPLEPAVNILAASYSFGSDFADVTARVKELLRDDHTFQANPGNLQIDPHPYWNKCLVIFCEVRGKRAIFSAGEGENVSRDLILEKAKPLPGPAAPPVGLSGPGSHPSSEPPRRTDEEEEAVQPLSSNMRPSLPRYVNLIRGDTKTRVDVRKARLNAAFDLKLQPGDFIEIPEPIW